MWKNSSIATPSTYNLTEKCNVVIFAEGKVMLLNFRHVYFEDVYVYGNKSFTLIKLPHIDTLNYMVPIIKAKTIYWKYLN